MKDVFSLPRAVSHITDDPYHILRPYSLIEGVDTLS